LVENGGAVFAEFIRREREGKSGEEEGEGDWGRLAVGEWDPLTCPFPCLFFQLTVFPF
jgi:hypothetical protein